MPLNLDYSGDWQYWDFTEPVTFTSIATGTNSPPQQVLTVSKALRGQPSFKERAPSGGAYSSADLTWLLPAALLAGKAVKVGDTIRDQQPAQTTWTVIGPLDFDQVDQVYQAYTVALSIHHQLASAVTFWRHDPTRSQQDAAGSRVPVFVQVGDAADCRFQLESETVEEGRGKRLWKKTYKVYLAAEVDLNSEWQLRDTDGAIYQVVDYTGRASITDLSVVTCERFGDSA